MKLNRNEYTKDDYIETTMLAKVQNFDPKQNKFQNLA